jgi:hypothetical protein
LFDDAFLKRIPKLENVPECIRSVLKEFPDRFPENLENNAIIIKVPAGVQLHVVHKKDGQSICVCIDPKFLNKALLREYHPIKTIEDV